MRIYLSGKITGLDEFEVIAKFLTAASELWEEGHDTIEPTEVAMAVSGLDWKAYMTIAYGIIHDPSVDAIYMLKDWTESPGAIIEWSWAQARGIPVLYQDPEHYIKYRTQE